MPVRFFCTACHKPLAISRRKAGTQIACPCCSHSMIVPGPARTRKRRTKSTPVGDETAVMEATLTLPIAAPLSAPAAPIEVPTVAAPAAAPSAAPAPPAMPTLEPRPGTMSPHLRYLLIGAGAAVIVIVFLLVGLGVILGLALAAQTEAEPKSVQAQVAPPAENAGDTAKKTVKEMPPVKAEPIAAKVAPLAPEPPALPGAPPAVPETAKLPAEETASNPDDGAKTAGTVVPLPVKKEPAPAVAPSPPDAKKIAASPVLQRLHAKRRSHLSSAELRKQLVRATEVDIESAPGTLKWISDTRNKDTDHTRTDLPLEVMARRPDLIGLRPRTGAASRLSHEEALELRILSKTLHGHVDAAKRVAGAGADLRPDPETLRQRLFDPEVRRQWVRPDAIPTLRQLLMPEHTNIRLILIEALAQIRGERASRELAQRALYDLHPDARAAALVALKERPTKHYVDVLIEGLRYPWPPVADHAAEALVALDLREAVPLLMPLLDAKDVDEPVTAEWGDRRMPVVRELVKINHGLNCLLCHPPGSASNDLVGAKIPLYGSVARRSGGKAGVCPVNSIRADITYLRQDFSVLQPQDVVGRDQPREQRFDYLIRLHPLTSVELANWHDKLKGSRAAPPQREALLFALRELTGENPGPQIADWKRLYSTISGERLKTPLEPGEYTALLRDALAKADLARQVQLLYAFKQRTGNDYDRAIAQAIPLLSTKLQLLARTTLADRLHCLSAQGLRERLTDSEPEIRIAALLVCRRRKERALTPDVIARLDDENDAVARKAYLLLKERTAHDFGPRRDASRAERHAAMIVWRDWWQKHQSKRAEEKRPGS